MKEIHQYINKETKEFRRKSTLHFISLVNNAVNIQKVTEEYNNWLTELRQLMSIRLYRQTIKVIETQKYKYKLVKNQFWKLRLIKAKAILKIIKIKMNKHHKEVILENSKQNFAIRFWFNQMLLILEELNLEFRYDINVNMDYKSKKMIQPVQTLVEYYLEFIYYLCLFSLKSNEIIELIAYIAIADKFLSYISFFSKSKLLYLLQNITLLKIKLLIENCEFLPAIENIKIFIRLCFREMHLYLDYDTKIYVISLSKFNSCDINKKEKVNKEIYMFCRIIQNIILAYFLRGVACEHLGYFKFSLHSYRQCQWFSNTFLYNFNKKLVNFFRKIRIKCFEFKDIYKDICNQILLYKKFDCKRNNEINPYLTQRYTKINNYTKRNDSCKIYTYRNENRRKSSSIESNKKNEKLITLLDSIGNNLYKEEKYRNNSIFKKFTVNSFVLSTVNMIDNLLSNPFNHILKKMEKVEVTKPQEDINQLINVTINYKRQKLFKNRINKINKNQKQKKINDNHIKNNSCIYLRNLKKDSCFNFKAKSLISLTKKPKFAKNDNEISFCNYKINKEKDSNLNILDNYNKLRLVKNKKNKTGNNSQILRKKILRYPLDKDILSKSLLSKRNYLDSLYEK